MKILLSAHIGYPWGGVSRRYGDLIQSSLNHKVFLTFFETSPDKNDFYSSGLFNFNNVIQAFIVSLKFFRVLLSSSPDIVHIATAHGYSFVKHSLLVLISKIMGKKVILAPHCSIKVFLASKNQLWNRWAHFIINLCDGVIVLSSEWLTLSDVIPKTKIMYLPNAIDITRYLSLPLDKKRNDNVIKFLFLGHIGREKGVFDLLKAAKLLNESYVTNYRIDIIGEALKIHEAEEAQKMIDEYHLCNNVHIYPAEFDGDKFHRLVDADVFILPSHHEGMPISIIEGMASGLPVIATDVGGIPDLVSSGDNGILVHPSCPEEIAFSIIQLIENPSLRIQMGKRGRIRACQHHDIEKYVDALVEYYSAVLNN
ncbi:MAG: glycosyltransferase family 4 protein [Anaerolineaceae bacterium]|nr:glycosyltransferase family 4 protein [Anaerolineaceae bacterium]